MRMTWDQLKHLPVRTRSGQALGVVTGLIVDPEAHAIVQYEVRRGMPLARTSLLIGTSQVVSITAECMTVEDGLVKSVQDDARIAAAEPSTGSLATSRGAAES